MLLSRRFDERCGEILKAGKKIPHYHSGIGQEALTVASVLPLKPTDQIIYSHRGYGQLLAKGISLTEIVLDTFMKAGGTNDGLGGVMHVHDPKRGVPGREGVFGGRFGIAVGLALAFRLRNTDDVVVCYYGEAAGARGILYESLNMAVLWHLPVVFIAENNGWSFSSRTEWLFPEGSMSRVWRGFEIPVEKIDGNDAEVVYESVRKAVLHARAGRGPSVIEGMTYRVEPHIWYDDARYQPPAEIAAWKERDPLTRVAERITAMKTGPKLLMTADDWATDQIKKAFNALADAPDATWADTAEELIPWQS